MKPTVYFATDHAGFALKEEVLAFVRDELQFPVEDCGARQFDPEDDYPDFIAAAALKLSKNPTNRALIFGGSGQGEAMVANRFAHVRATVFYGEPPVAPADQAGVPLGIIAASREHNDANALSIGARFVSVEAAKQAVQQWLGATFSGNPRHTRRLRKLEQLGR